MSVFGWNKYREEHKSYEVDQVGSVEKLHPSILIRCQEGKMSGMFCTSLIRVYLLPLSHMLIATNQIILIHQTVIILLEHQTFCIATFKMVVRLIHLLLLKVNR